MRSESTRWRSVTLALATLVALGLLGHVAQQRDPLRQAWRAASETQTYRFEGSSLTRAAAGIGQVQVRGTGDLEGRLDLRLQDADGRGESRIRIHWPEAERLEEGVAGEALDPHALALALPLGDPLALLAVGQGAKEGEVSTVGARPCRQVTFRVSSGAYAAWLADHPRWLPLNAGSGGKDRFSAEATLWMELDTDLPCRIQARVELPRLGGGQPGSAEIDWRYMDWKAVDEG